LPFWRPCANWCPLELKRSLLFRWAALLF
jgi:hypothetical protein